MSADLLRRAATLMRARAEAATPSPWFADRRMVVASPGPNARYVADCYDDDPKRPDQDHQHIASWHPAVALAVADVLDETAATHDDPYYRENYDDLIRPALAVARAYLGEAADD